MWHMAIDISEICITTVSQSTQCVGCLSNFIICNPAAIEKHSLHMFGNEI